MMLGHRSTDEQVLERERVPSMMPMDENTVVHQLPKERVLPRQPQWDRLWLVYQGRATMFLELLLGLLGQNQTPGFFRSLDHLFDGMAWILQILQVWQRESVVLHRVVTSFRLSILEALAEAWYQLSVFHLVCEDGVSHLRGYRSSFSRFERLFADMGLSACTMERTLHNCFQKPFADPSSLVFRLPKAKKEETNERFRLLLFFYLCWTSELLPHNEEGCRLAASKVMESVKSGSVEPFMAAVEQAANRMSDPQVRRLRLIKRTSHFLFAEHALLLL
mmetsp:Transcript_5033/g.10903  ORF Transcript_5033/g.10903 Transcript_5033/m.10903 type:complete len:277 (+) Transcript_5033:1640-2470(+)